MLRYIIIGAGAIGGAVGGRLTQYGHRCVLAGRGEHLAAMQAEGLRVRSPEGDLTLEVTAVGGPAEVELTLDDVLVVATKTHQADAALAAWTDRPVFAQGSIVGTAGDRLPVLMALNGVASEQMALRYFSRVFGVCVWMPAVHLVPGEVIIRGEPWSGVFHIGRVPPAPDDELDGRLLDELERDWTSSQLSVTRPAEVMPWKYRKLISNIGNVFQALVGPGGGSGPLVAAAEGEARMILDRAGIGYTSDEEESAARADGFTIKPVAGEPAELGGSTWQSLTRGTGNVETDYLNGEIAQIAHSHGLTAPINAGVASAARLAAARGQKPGAVTADELAELLNL